MLGLLAFVATLVLQAPASLLYAWTQDPAQPGRVRLHGVHGSLVAGGFAALSVNNRPVLREARWTLQPLWLALLRFSADLETGGDAVVRVQVSRAVLGTLRLSDLSAAGSVKALLGMLGQPNLPIEGQVRLDLPLVKIDRGAPIAAEGTADVENLTWTLAREPLALGSFNAALSTDDQGVLVNLGSGSGPLEVSGNATLSRERAYELRLQLRPRPDAAPALLTLLRSLGAPDAQGWYHVARSGALP